MSFGGKERNCTSRESYELLLLTKEITTTEHIFTDFFIRKSSFLHIFCKVCKREKGRCGRDCCVILLQRAHSVTEFYLISSVFLLNKCFLSLIICGIFSIASTSHADGREMQWRWLRTWRQWTVKNHAKSHVETPVIFLSCTEKDNFFTLFTSGM